jgi:hypothetical protein
MLGADCLYSTPLGLRPVPGACAPGHGREDHGFPVPPIMLAKILAKNKMGSANLANPLIFLVGRQGLEP